MAEMDLKEYREGFGSGSRTGVKECALVSERGVDELIRAWTEIVSSVGL